MASETSGIEKLAVRANWAAWFETHGVIEDAEGNRRGSGYDEELVANYLQRRIAEVAAWFEEEGLPCRMLILKPRQRGCSTFSTSGMYCELNKVPKRACIIGAKGEQAKNLFRMAKLYSDEDRFDWGTKRNWRTEDSVFTFPDGRTSRLGILSAKEFDPGRSGTFQFLLATEVARWTEGKDAVANAAEVMSGLLKCVALKQGTTVVLETTARGASGDFYSRWMGALEFEELKDMHRRGDLVRGRYVRIFAPWYEFPDLRLELTPEQSDRITATLGKITRYNSPDFGSENDIISRFGLSLEQVAWRRLAIDEECQKDPRIFEQDYPSTWETAFLRSGNRVFNASHLRDMRRVAEAAPFQWGMLEANRDDPTMVSWRKGEEEECLVKRWEEPRRGERYLICADVMTGQDMTTGADPDCHSVFVLKAGGWVSGKGWVRPKTVARLKRPCRFETDLLCEWIRRLHWYYRGALVVPELNNPGLAVVKRLRDWSLPIYEQEVYDQYEMKTKKRLGWVTNAKTKPMVIGELVGAVRDYHDEGSGFDILDVDAIDEMNAYVRKQSGETEAMDGWHDDDVMSLGIGYNLIGSATPYRELVREAAVPQDILNVLREEERLVSGRSQFS